MSDGERTVTASVAPRDAAAQSPPRGDGLPAAEPPGEEYSTGQPGWPFITAAARRGAWLWVTTAVLGLIIGAGYYTRHASYQATTSVVLVPNPVELPTDAILTDIALAQSHTVAAQAVRKLGLPESPSSFLASYKVTAVTDRVLQISLKASSSGEAVKAAHAVAAAFLQYRAEQFRAEEQHALTALQLQVTQAKQQLNTLTRQINQLAAQSATPVQQARLTALRAQRVEAQTQLPALQQAVTTSQVTTRQTTAQLVQGSQILDAAMAGSPGRVKHVAEYAAGGLLAGLVLGLVIVVVRALVSNRLRRRDDVAHALGVPVRLSVTRVRGPRWRPGGRGLAAAQRPPVQRIVAHLREALPRGGTRPAALAVVAVNDTQEPALSVVSLALSYAQQGRQVMLADLSHGTSAARLLGVRQPGIGTVTVDGAHLVVAVPGDEAAPGPLRPAVPSGQRPDPELARAAASADILLTLVQLDPSLGGEHLVTWARTAVIMVTAGRSSWTKIHAVGEMTRLAGTRPVSAVLLDADTTDESLGAARPATAPAQPGPPSGMADPRPAPGPADPRPAPGPADPRPAPEPADPRPAPEPPAQVDEAWRITQR